MWAVETEATTLAGVGFEPMGADVITGPSGMEMRELLSVLALLGLNGYINAPCSRRLRWAEGWSLLEARAPLCYHLRGLYHTRPREGHRPFRGPTGPGGGLRKFFLSYLADCEGAVGGLTT